MQNPDFKIPFQDLTNLVPQNLRNEVLSSLLDTLFNRQLTHDESVPLYGYVGRKPASPDDRSPRVPQPDPERDLNSVIPVLSFPLGAERVCFTVQDLIRKAEALGIPSTSLQYLYSQGNNYAPPIDFDKFTNFFNYYWVAGAVPAAPDLPWNPELLPEYYTIAVPRPGDPDKLNVVAASAASVVLTGTGFPAMSFSVAFSDPTHFTVTPQPPGVIQSGPQSFALTTNSDRFAYVVGGTPLLSFDIVREENFDQFGISTGIASFVAGDTFTVTPTFLTRNYTVTFTGVPGTIRGKLTNVASLDAYQTIDGVLLRRGDRVLIKNNSAADDGIYVVSPGVWSRAPDFDGVTRAAGARVFVRGGIANGGQLFASIAGAGGFGWIPVPGATESNTNPWQEGNFWVSAAELSILGLLRGAAVQAVRPIIEYAGDLQLNRFVKNGLPSDSGISYHQTKTTFNQLPLFDLFRYDGTHAGLVSSVFYYEEDLTADLDLDLQKRVLISTNDSADFIFNHGLADGDGQLLFVKRGGALKTIWHPGYTAPTVVAVQFAGAGNGTLEGSAALGFTQQQIWTITAVTSSTFSVSGSKLQMVPLPATVGTPYTNGEISFTLHAGSIPFQAGDAFTLSVGNLESPRYAFRDALDNIVDRYGGTALDPDQQGAWLIPRTFYNNPYNDSRAPITEGVLYSHFLSIMANQLPGSTDLAFGGSIKLWSEQQTLLAALLMQRDLTPISMIDLAERQYEVALSAVGDLFRQQIVQYLGDHGTISTLDQVDALLDHIQGIRAADDDVRTVLYDSTSALVGFPSTLPQLGVLPLVEPGIGFDPILGRTLLTHHDGHRSLLAVDDLDFRQTVLGDPSTPRILRSDGVLTGTLGSVSASPPSAPYRGELWMRPDGTILAYQVASDLVAPTLPTDGTLWYDRPTNRLFAWHQGWVLQPDPAAPWTAVNLADVLNSLLLRAEQRLHGGINPNARKYDFGALVGDAAFDDLLKRELFSFAATNGYDPLGPEYDPADAFTWRYALADRASLPALPAGAVPARWHRLLMAHQAAVNALLSGTPTAPMVVPTARPNLEPWKLLGEADEATWWAGLTPAQRAAYTPYVQLSALDGTYLAGPSVRAVSVVPGITPLIGLTSVDGIALVQGDRVLLQRETSPQNNGIWIVSVGSWVRDSTPLLQRLVLQVIAGARYRGSTWVLTATPPDSASPILFAQARTWTDQLWADIKAARPGLRLSVDTVNDTLLPPYVSSAAGASADALTTVIPPGVALGYDFGEGSPVETVWNSSLEHGYSLARALFRFDPLAFLGFCWGFCWVEVDGILYDGFDLNMPGHQRFRLHGEPVAPIARAALDIAGVGDPLVLTYDAYDAERGQNFSAARAGAVIGHARVGVPATIGGISFTLHDEGRPFRIGDRFEIANGVSSFVPIATHRCLGFGQTFTHALRAISVDTSSGYAIAAYRGFDVNMGYRAGGLVSTDDLQVYTERATLSTSAYDLRFKQNQIARNEWIQALRISVIQFGAAVDRAGGHAPPMDGADWTFRIEGYNPRYLDLTYYELDVSTNPVDFYALDRTHTDRAWLQGTTITGSRTVSLPITIVGVQRVITFLFGYARYLEDRGWEFNKIGGENNIDALTGRVRNFQLEIEKFVDAVFGGIQLGQGHVVNPFMDRAWFNQSTGLLAEFMDSSMFDVTGNPGVFDVLGVKYRKDDLQVVRTNAESSIGATGPMFSAHVQMDEFEHLFVFENFSAPSTASGLLYDPFSGSRVVTYKFNGRMQGTGTMRPEFGGHFLVGHEVRQNLQGAADGFRHFYDANHAFEHNATSRHALALLGFDTKPYFDDLDISEKTQFNFWRGLIQLKGTNMSIEAYLNNNRFDDARLDEYWAYKVAQYGDARERTFPELKLSVNDALTQFTQLQFDDDSLQADGFTPIYGYDETRWFSIDDLNLENYFGAEVVGTYADVLEAPALVALPFIADHLVLSGNATQLNATTLEVTPGVLSVIGYGPARPRFNPVKLFDDVSKELVAEIPIWHPAVGQHTPTALEGVNVISALNPARYNFSTQAVNNNTYDPLRPWGENELGRVWFDTGNLAYLPYHDGTIFGLAERLSRWGTLADYATIDVYEWVRSSVPPTQYNALAAAQAGDASLDPSTKAAGQVAGQQTYMRMRSWFARPIAWSYSPVPVNVDWGSTPPFPGGSFDSRLYFDAGSTASLEKGSFAEYGITAGMRLGAWDIAPTVPRPVSEYEIGTQFSKIFVTSTGAALAPLASSVGFPCTVTVVALTDTPLSGQLAFYAVPTLVTLQTAVIPIGELVLELDTPSVPDVPVWDVSTAVRAVLDGTVEETSIVFSTVGTLDDSSALHGATITVTAGELLNVDFPGFGVRAVVTVVTGGTYGAEALRDALVDALGASVHVRNSVNISPIVIGANITSPLSNDPLDPWTSFGWRAWIVPTQAQLDADAAQPSSSWKPYVGTYVSIAGTLQQIQDAIALAKAPLTLNDGTVVDRYRTAWSNWEVLKNLVLESTVTATGPAPFVGAANFDGTRTSVYVNGIAQLKAAYSIDGRSLTVASVPRGARVTVIVRRHEPTPAELGFNPELRDDLAIQQQYKQDYEYVSLPVRDRDGSITSTAYYFWVRNKTTAAQGKKLSVQAIAQELRDGPPNFLTFQNIRSASAGFRYDAITISGLSYIVTKDDTYKLRFTRNFTLRDDPEEWNLKNVHTEWALIRAGQKTLIPEPLWRKLTDAVAGEDVAGSAVPALRRVLYDERHGTQTQFGFGPEQTLAPSGLLRSSITFTILNTSLVDTSGQVPVPAYIEFLDLNRSDTWFANPVVARTTMTNIWTQGTVQQVNEIFFATLHDVLANNYAVTDLFKTSRLSAYSVKVVHAAPATQTYE